LACPLFNGSHNVGKTGPGGKKAPYHGNFYIRNLGLFPVVPGSSKIFKITPSGQIKTDTSG